MEIVRADTLAEFCDVYSKSCTPVAVVTDCTHGLHHQAVPAGLSFTIVLTPSYAPFDMSLHCVAVAILLLVVLAVLLRQIARIVCTTMAVPAGMCGGGAWKHLDNTVIRNAGTFNSAAVFCCVFCSVRLPALPAPPWQSLLAFS